jgi:hypothetical protein
MIPAQVRYDPNATPPQFTDNEDYRVEPGTHIRVKIMGTRSEVGEMWAIGTINEDYLGYLFSLVNPYPRIMLIILDLSDLRGPSAVWTPTLGSLLPACQRGSRRGTAALISVASGLKTRLGGLLSRLGVCLSFWKV